MDNSVQNVQNQPMTTPYPPNAGQRSAMPPITAESLQAGLPVPLAAQAMSPQPIVALQAPAPVQAVPQVPVNTPAAPIATPSSVSLNREGGPMQTVINNEDSEQTNLTQAFTPPVEDDSQKAAPQYVPTSEMQQEDVQKTTQQYIPSQQEAGQAVMQEGIQPSIPEVAISQELAHMVEAAKEAESPFLPPELQKSGMQAAKDAVPVPPNPLGVTVMPMSYQKSVETIEKTRKSKLSEGVRWFSEFVAYQWRKVNPKVYK